VADGAPRQNQEETKYHDPDADTHQHQQRPGDLSRGGNPAPPRIDPVPTAARIRAQFVR
jgi:hypothetical protein